MAAQEPERWRIISADRSIEVVQSNIQKIILDYLE
jgi:thymidylate kinase